MPPAAMQPMKGSLLTYSCANKTSVMSNRPSPLASPYTNWPVLCKFDIALCGVDRSALLPCKKNGSCTSLTLSSSHSSTKDTLGLVSILLLSEPSINGRSPATNQHADESLNPPFRTHGRSAVLVAILVRNPNNLGCPEDMGMIVSRAICKSAPITSLPESAPMICAVPTSFFTLQLNNPDHAEPDVHDDMCIFEALNTTVTSNPLTLELAHRSLTGTTMA